MLPKWLPVALVLLGVAIWVLWPRSSAITRENAARIELGMTVAEVEAILDVAAQLPPEAPTLPISTACLATSLIDDVEVCSAP